MPVSNDSLENYTEEQRANMARAMHTLLNNPDVARDTKKLLKKVDPKLSFPDVDVDERFTAFEERQREKDREREESDRVRRANESYQATVARVKERGFTVEEVETVMKEKGIANYDTAMEYIDNQRQLAPPTADSLNSMSMPSETKDIMKNPRGWAQNAAHEAVNDLIRARKRA